MRDKEKVENVLQVLDDHEHLRCPYCHEPLEIFFHHNEKRFGCKNHKDRLRINEVDYLWAIEYIARWGVTKEPKRVKRLVDTYEEM